MPPLRFRRVVVSTRYQEGAQDRAALLGPKSHKKLTIPRLTASISRGLASANRGTPLQVRAVLNSKKARRSKMSVNKAIIVGRLGQDPELKHTASGTSVCTFSVATDENWMDKQGQKQARTEWHRIVVWSKQARKLRPIPLQGETSLSGRPHSNPFLGGQPGPKALHHGDRGQYRAVFGPGQRELYRQRGPLQQCDDGQFRHAPWPPPCPGQQRQLVGTDDLCPRQGLQLHRRRYSLLGTHHRAPNLK